MARQSINIMVLERGRETIILATSLLVPLSAKKAEKRDEPTIIKNIILVTRTESSRPSLMIGRAFRPRHSAITKVTKAAMPDASASHSPLLTA